MSLRIKKNDKVIVIAGKHRGETSSIVRVLGKKNTVLLDGLNLVKKHRRAGQPGKGQIVDKPMPIHASNVMIVDPKSGKPTRIKIVRSKDGMQRVAVKSGEMLK